MSYINSLSASSSTYSVNESFSNRRSDIKPGVIELNKIKIRINEGDSLQRICNKINSKTSLHGVTAKLVRERGHTVISLSSIKQIDILDRNNILNNIGMRIRANLARNSLVDGLILTTLAEHKSSSRYIAQPISSYLRATSQQHSAQEEVNEAADDSFVSARSHISDEEQIADLVEEDDDVAPPFDLQVPVINVLPVVKKIGDTYEEYKKLSKSEQQKLRRVAQVALYDKKIADLKINRFSQYDVDFKKLSSEDFFYLYDLQSISKSRSRKK